MFVEARDVTDPSIEPIYTTLQLQFFETFSYFSRKPGSGSLALTVNEVLPTHVPFYDLSSLVTNPNKTKLFFNVYNNCKKNNEKTKLMKKKFNLKKKIFF